MNLDPYLRSVRHIGKVDISVATMDVHHLPFCVQMIKVPDSRKPYFTKKLYRSVSESSSEQLASSNVLLVLKLLLHPLFIHFIKPRHPSSSHRKIKSQRLNCSTKNHI